MKPVKCSLSKVVEAFLVGTTFLLGGQQFRLLFAMDQARQQMLYLIYRVVMFICLLLGMTIDRYYPQGFCWCLIMQIVCWTVAFVLKKVMTPIFLVSLVLVVLMAIVVAFVLIHSACAYSNHPASAVALLCGAFFSFLIPKTYRMILEAHDPTVVQDVLTRRIADMSAITIFCATWIPLQMRYANGEIGGLSIKEMRKRYSQFTNSGGHGSTWTYQAQYLIGVWNSGATMWESVANMAAMIALIIAAQPSSILTQLPISPSWLEDIEVLESWLLNAGLLTGAFLPLTDYVRCLLPLLIVTVYLMHTTCSLAFMYFTWAPWFQPYAVNTMCAATCWMYGYTISCTLSRIVTVFFTRSCREMNAEDQCCKDITGSWCPSEDHAYHHICEFRVEPLEAVVAKKTETGEKVSPTSTECTEGDGVTKCAADAADECHQVCTGGKSDSKEANDGCASKESEGKQAADVEKGATDKKPKCAAINHIIWVRSPHKSIGGRRCFPLLCTCPKNQGQEGEENNRCCLLCSVRFNEGKCNDVCTAEDVVKSPQTIMEQKCICRESLMLKCRDACQGCYCGNSSSGPEKQVHCCEQALRSCTQHYLLGSTHAYTHDRTHITLFLEGTPIGRPGKVCCLPAGYPPPDPCLWKRYNPKTDRIFIGYVGTECAVCSILEIRKSDVVADYSNTTDYESPQNFSITNIVFGSCCHAAFFLRLDCMKRGVYDANGHGNYLSKEYTLSYVYISTAAMTEAETDKNRQRSICNGRVVEVLQLESQNCPTDGGCGKASLCCFGVATRVFAYSRNMNVEDSSGCMPKKTDGRQTTSSCRCPTDGKCVDGCCIKLQVTDDISIQKVRDAHRFTVVVRFSILLAVFILGLRSLIWFYSNRGVGGPFKFPMDVNKLWKTVAHSKWNDTVLDTLASTDSEVLRVRGHNTEEGFKSVLTSLSLFIPDKSQHFEELVRQKVSSHFPQTDGLPNNSNYYTLCVALCLDATKACFMERLDALEIYLLKWEDKWRKEISNYNDSLKTVIAGHGYVSRVAQSFYYDNQMTNKDKDAISQARQSSWEQIVEELELSKEVNAQEERLQQIRAEATPGRRPTIRERLEIVWKHRIRHIKGWMRNKRCLYDWRGFLASYHQLQLYFSEEDTMFQRL